MSTVVQQFRSELFFPCAVRIVLPLTARAADLTGSSKTRQLMETSQQNGFIARPIHWRSKCPPDRMIDEDTSGRSNFAHDVESCADDQCRNPLGLYDVCNQTDGLVAERSIGYEQDEVHCRGGQLGSQRRR